MRNMRDKAETWEERKLRQNRLDTKLQEKQTKKKELKREKTQEE